MPKKDKREYRRYSPVAVVGFIFALLAGCAEIVAGFGTRWGLWDYRQGFAILRWAAYAGIAVSLISLVGCFMARPGGMRRGFVLSLGGLLIAIAVSASRGPYS